MRRAGTWKTITGRKGKEMKAGRKLDAKIAKEVMEWHIEKDAITGEDDIWADNRGRFVQGVDTTWFPPPA